MRVFLGVFPPAPVQDEAARVIESLRRAHDGVSWVKRDNLHYTMRFLGEVGEDGASRIEAAAFEAAAASAPFTAMLGAAGAFPDPRHARVLWLGLDPGAAELGQLAAALDSALARRGFAPERRRFSAHLTIGRVRDPRGRNWSDALAAAAPARAPFEVNELLVVESRLSPDGSIYTPRARAALGSGREGANDRPG